MTFTDKLKEILDQGAAVTKDFAVKAGAKAQDLGERGILMVEIKQLENQVIKLIGRLGAEAYQTFADKKEENLSADNIAVKGLLAEIAQLKDSIEKKEAALLLKKNTV